MTYRAKIFYIRMVLDCPNKKLVNCLAKQGKEIRTHNAVVETDASAT